MRENWSLADGSSGRPDRVFAVEESGRLALLEFVEPGPEIRKAVGALGVGRGAQIHRVAEIVGAGEAQQCAFDAGVAGLLQTIVVRRSRRRRSPRDLPTGIDFRAVRCAGAELWPWHSPLDGIAPKCRAVSKVAYVNVVLINDADAFLAIWPGKSDSRGQAFSPPPREKRGRPWLCHGRPPRTSSVSYRFQKLESGITVSKFVTVKLESVLPPRCRSKVSSSAPPFSLA